MTRKQLIILIVAGILTVAAIMISKGCVDSGGHDHEREHPSETTPAEHDDHDHDEVAASDQAHDEADGHGPEGGSADHEGHDH